jgi:hypothetical protein
MSRKTVTLLRLLLVALITTAFISRSGQTQTQTEEAKATLRAENRNHRYGTANQGSPRLTRYPQGGESKWMPPLPFIDPNKSTKAIALEIEAKRNANVCNAGLVAFGTIKRKDAQMTADETNIYTVFELSPDEIWKNNQQSPVQPSQTIEFTAPGGSVLYNNARYTTNHISIPKLMTEAKYVLLLAYARPAEDYYVMNAESVYLVQEGEVIRGDHLKRSYPKIAMRHEATLGQPTTLADLRTAIQNAPICKQ